jgi:3-oxoacyl-[acyl-carrier protein] reductase
VNGGRELDGLVALVTGGSRRIGLEIGRELAEAGAKIVVNYANDDAQAARAVRIIEEAGGRALAMRADVRYPAQVKAMVDRAVRELGGVDLLINNAASRPHRPLAEISVEEWHRVLGIALDGAFVCAQACEAHLVRTGRGSIVNIGGAVAMMGHANALPVSAAKMGLIGVTRSLAHHFGPLGVTVNCLAPGSIGSEEDDAERRARRHPLDEIPLRRIGTPQDVARAVRALVGPAFRFLTGQTIHLNGGIYMA